MVLRAIYLIISFNVQQEIDGTIIQVFQKYAIKYENPNTRSIKVCFQNI